MSILAALGASPSSFTVPLMLAAVAGSIGVAAAAGAAVGAAAGCSSFLPHPARRTNPSKAARLQTAMDVFVFMISSYLSEILKHKTMKNYSGANLFRRAAATVAGRFRA